MLWPHQREFRQRKLCWSWGTSVTPDLCCLGGLLPETSLRLWLTSSRPSGALWSLLTATLCVVTLEFATAFGPLPTSSPLPPEGPRVSTAQWLLHRLKLISFPRWPIIKAWNLRWWAEAGKETGGGILFWTLLATNLENTILLVSTNSLVLNAARRSRRLQASALLAAVAFWQVCWPRK